MTPLVLGATALLLAYANGANDNFKAAATLWGSRTTSFWTAITWTTVTTAAGSMTAVLLAGTLLNLFSGKGVVPEALAATPSFVLALVLGASKLGVPVSTTHVSVGSLFGLGLRSGRLRASTASQIILSWVVTLPISALLGALIWLLAS